MGQRVHRPWLARFALGFIALLWMNGATTRAADPADAALPDSAAPTVSKSVEERLRELEQQFSSLAEENRRLSAQLRERPEVTEGAASEFEMAPVSAADEGPAYHAGYDHGFFISPRDPGQFPFEFRFNNQAQLRYAGFARDVETWTDSAGIVSPVNNRSAFELTRGRAIFSGYAFDPDLTYNLSIDYTTVSDSQINFWNYWVGYRFSRGFSVFAGQAAVPGCREWLTPAFFTLGPDYTLATTFFRPSLSQGIWITGEPIDNLRYRIMLCDGFNTLGSSPNELDSRMTLSGSVWAEPWGEFGTGFSDLEWDDDAAVRLGGSFTLSPIEGQQGNPNLPENNDIRLTDGTLLTQPGALALGVTLNMYTVALGAVDLGWKYRGISLSGEFFMRDLFDLRGNGPIPRNSIFDFGGYVQAGYFVLPQKFEVYGRTSQVTGPFGSGSEYAGGCNWFWLAGKQNLRCTLDIAWLNHSPADQARTGYRAGDTGLLVRSQFQILF